MPAQTSPSLLEDMPQQIPIDTEHLGVRIVIPLMALAGIIGGFILGRVVAVALDESIGTLCFSLGFAVVGMGVMLQLGERFVKPNWSSGRHIELQPDQLIVIDRRPSQEKDITFNWRAELDTIAYFWEVDTGKSRVRKGWYCVAVQLRQDEQQAVFYTFLSPEDAAAIPRFHEWFVRLLPKKNREDLIKVDPREAARQERYRKIESYRWFDGAELESSHFAALMHFVSQHGTVSERNRNV